MTLAEIERASSEIDSLVSSQMFLIDEEIKPIHDGIIDPERYIGSKYKILWILKEPYDDDMEGGWDFKGMIKGKNSIFEFATGRNTFRPIIYSSWGILNNFCLFDDMDNIEDVPSMLNAFKSIAYINIKKTPGARSSNSQTVQYYYQKHKDLLLKQVNYINADIIIGGNTLQYLQGDLNLKSENRRQFNRLSYYQCANKLYINAYHPAQRPSLTKVSLEQYCDDIINVAKIWATTK